MSTSIPLVSTSPIGATQTYSAVSSAIPTASVAPSSGGFGSLIGNAFSGLLNTVTQAGQNAATIVTTGWLNDLAADRGLSIQGDSSPIAETEYTPVRTAPVSTGISTQEKLLIGGGAAGGLLLLVLLLKK